MKKIHNVEPLLGVWSGVIRRYKYMSKSMYVEQVQSMIVILLSCWGVEQHPACSLGVHSSEH